VNAARPQAPQGVREPKPITPLAVRTDTALQQKLAAVLGPGAPSTAVVVKDLQSGHGVSLNAGRTFFPASLFKLFVMYEAFHQQSLGLLQFERQVQITPYYDAFGLGPRRTRLCQRLSVREALEAMMSTSDNAAAILLQDVVGSGNINNSLAALGLKSSHYLSEELTTSAADIALLLEGIGRNLTISRAASLDMVRLMISEEFDNGLKGGLPPGVLVAHKTGNWSPAIHEAGLVFAPSGTYVFVALSEAANAPSLIKELSKTVHDHFAAR
jgi:beta-lactamase class A